VVVVRHGRPSVARALSHGPFALVGYHPAVEQLRRRLGIPGATAIGVASMLGAGVFVVWAPATAVAGSAVLIALPLAAAIAALNATSTTRLAMRHPVSGGAYAYGRAELGPTAGFAAGVLFLLGKTASVAAIALVGGGYLWPGFERPVAIALVVVLAVVNATGVRSTAIVSAIAAAVVIVVLVAVLGLSVPDADASRLAGVAQPLGVLPATGLIFFAFAGYARIATLGEEVRDPVRTLPRAVLLAVATVFLLSAATLVALLAGLGVDGLAASRAPVAELAGPGWDVAVRAAAGIACAGSLAGVLAGLSRTGMAMARDGELPSALARIGRRTATPIVSDAAVAVVAVVAVLLLEPAQVIGVSACAVLGYYAIAHLAALRAAQTLSLPRGIPVAGLAGCLLVALTTSWPALLGVVAVLALALAVRALAGRSRSA
jgi:APA family basic amino acid/polyamine antiporter